MISTLETNLIGAIINYIFIAWLRGSLIGDGTMT